MLGTVALPAHRLSPHIAPSPTAPAAGASESLRPLCPPDGCGGHHGDAPAREVMVRSVRRRWLQEANAALLRCRTLWPSATPMASFLGNSEID